MWPLVSAFGTGVRVGCPYVLLVFLVRFPAVIIFLHTMLSQSMVGHKHRFSDPVLGLAVDRYVMPCHAQYFRCIGAPGPAWRAMETFADPGRRRRQWIGLSAMQAVATVPVRP